MSNYYSNYGQYLGAQRCCNSKTPGPQGLVGPTGPALEFYRNQIDTLRSKLGGKSTDAKTPAPNPDFEPSNTFTRFEERAAHVQELLKEFSIQRRSQSEKDENNKNAEAKGS